jgi:class 3 adenylate cyclase
MASFGSVSRAVECAIAIQRKLAEHNVEHSEEAIVIRIGLAAGEPVTKSGDLFVQPCNSLRAFVRDRDRAPSWFRLPCTVLGRHFVFGSRKKLMLRGFDQPIHAYEVDWQPIS